MELTVLLVLRVLSVNQASTYSRSLLIITRINNGAIMSLKPIIFSNS